MSDNTQTDIEWREKGFYFYSNTKCEYFPCHKIGSGMEKTFNCLFCYCPLYEYEDCGGTFTYLDNGWKNCMDCLLPHIKDNYGLVIGRLKTKQTEHCKQRRD